jgi:membrane protein
MQHEAEHSEGEGPRMDSVRPTGVARLHPVERAGKPLPHRWLRSLWNLQGVPVRVLAVRTWRSLLADRIFGHSAELGFYFLFALFPALFCASSILGLAARSADRIYDRLLDYLALVIPTSALGTIIDTFNQTTAASTPGKLTFGLVVALWSASVGISAIQDTLNAVYKIQETRSFLRARFDAIGLTVLLSLMVTGGLGSMFGADAAARFMHAHLQDRVLGDGAASIARLMGWTGAAVLLTLCFTVIHYWAPNRKARSWHWITPGSFIGIAGWVAASLGLRAYLHYFNNYSVIYGSLGAVIILLTWFYTTGLMLLAGAEIDSAIEAAAAEKQGSVLNARPPQPDHQ